MRLPVRLHRSACAAALAGSVLLAGTLVPLAHADDDDLSGRKHRVERLISGAHDDLDESSDRLRGAATALDSARARLGTARDHLSATREQLLAARLLDQQQAARLTAATAELVQARADVVTARTRIEQEQLTLRRMVVDQYQDGDPTLMGLSMVLTTQDPAQLTGQLHSVQSVLDKQSVVLARLEAARSVLTVQQQQLAGARDGVRRQRAAAAAQLTRTQAVETAAQQAESSVASSVSARASARGAAAAAERADRAELRRLDGERDRLTTLLRKRAAEARARARARARASARAARAAGLAAARARAVPSSGVLAPPLAGPITSPFGWRIHPLFGYRSLHDGDDFGAACGTPIRASAAGTVLERAYLSAWGNRVVIDHGLLDGHGVATIANHLDAPALVAPGQHVDRGQVIGYVGTTGWSTGCHLHFTVLQDGVAVDPQSWL